MTSRPERRMKAARDLCAELKAEGRNRDAQVVQDLCASASASQTLNRKRFEEVAGLKAENTRLREALAWYGDKARLCHLGDPGRVKLAEDGGKRALTLLLEQPHD